MYSAITTRPHVKPTEQVMMLIGNGHCWHFDAWMMQDRGGSLYVLAETRSGGRDVLTRNSYQVLGGGLHYCPELPEHRELVTLQDKALWPRFDELNELHWNWIVPMALRVPSGFRSRSVALHYVRAPSLEPFDGTEANLHQYASNATS